MLKNIWFLIVFRPCSVVIWGLQVKGTSFHMLMFDRFSCTFMYLGGENKGTNNQIQFQNHLCSWLILWYDAPLNLILYYGFSISLFYLVKKGPFRILSTYACGMLVLRKRQFPISIYRSQICRIFWQLHVVLCTKCRCIIGRISCIIGRIWQMHYIMATMLQI